MAVYGKINNRNQQKQHFKHCSFITYSFKQILINSNSKRRFKVYKTGLMVQTNQYKLLCALIHIL